MTTSTFSLAATGGGIDPIILIVAAAVVVLGIVAIVIARVRGRRAE